MRIWLQKHTVEGRLPLLDAIYRRHAAAVLDPATEVRVEGLPAATYGASLPAGIASYDAAEAMFSWYFAAQSFAAERAGYDAYAIGATTDPGLADARSISAIPVLGLGETAFLACAELGLAFGVVGAVAELEERLRANIDGYGLRRRLAGFAYLEDGPALVRQALEGDPAPFLSSFEEAAREVAGLGARVIIPGEGLPNEVLFGAGIEEAGGAPILDTSGLLLKAAQHQAELRRSGLWRPPGAGAQRPLPESERDRLFALYAPPAITRPGPAADTA